MKILKFVFITFLTLMLVGCRGEIVARGIDQKQANEIVATLSKSQISSEVKDDENAKRMFKVVVCKKDYINAVSLLTSKGLPREREATFTDLVSQKGILPDSKRMESLRLDKALSLEIQESILNFPGIVNANVVVRNEFAKDNKEDAQVSVMLITEPLFSELDIYDIEKVIKSSIPGIKDDNINILTKKDSSKTVLENLGLQVKGDSVSALTLDKFLSKWRVVKEDKNSLTLFFVLVLCLVFIIAGVVFYFVGYKRAIKKYRLKIVEAPSNNLLARNNN